MNSIPFNIGSITVGGKVLATSGLIIYHAEFEGSTTQASSMYRTDQANGMRGSANSAITTGKKFILHAARMEQASADASGSLNPALGYGDAFVTNTSPPANLKGMITGENNCVKADGIFGGKIPGVTVKEIAVHGVVPAGKFPCVVGLSNSTVGWITCYGYEVDA